jgi:tetratricopeptide (TPR) repeat protein
MRKRTSESLFILAGTAGLAAGAGFLAAAYYLERPEPEADKRLEVLAECGFAAGADIRDSTLRLRCGLEQSEIERLFADVVAGLGFDGILAGRDPTRADVEEAGQRLGLTVDAVEALIAQIRQGGVGPAGIDRSIEVAVRAATPAPSDGSVPTSLIPVGFGPEDIVVGKPETEAEVRVLDRVRAKCGAAAGAGIEGSVIDVACGPAPEEVQALIDQFVAASGAEGIRDALAQDAAGREQLIAALSGSFGLEDDLVAAVLAGLEGSDTSEDGAAAALDAALSARMQQALLLLRIGQTGDALGSRQSEIAAAVVAGDAAGADRLMRETGEMLRPLAQDLAPEVLPPLVDAARLVEAARESLAAGAFKDGIEGLARAGDLVRADWPLMGRGFDIAAADALTDPRARATLGAAEDVSAGIWLGVADDLHETALTLGLASAEQLGTVGETAVGDDLLERAEAVLARLAPLVTPEGDPWRYVALESELASLSRARAQRSGDIRQLEKAKAEADAALAVAEKLGEDEAVRRLTTWAIVELDLGRWTGDASHLDSALAAFERVAAARDAETDLVGWASAQNNIAVVQADKAGLERDTALLSDAAGTYRGVARRIDPESHPADWVLYTRNLASTLVTLGAWEGSSSPVREAIDELEKLRAFDAEDNADLASANTIEALARAWWQIGQLDADLEAHQKAAALMGEAVQIYDPATAARSRVVSQRSQGDIYRDAGELASDPAIFAAAAESYAAARATADASGQRQLYVDLALRQADALWRAAALGQSPDGAEDPATLVEHASAIIDALPPDEATPEWERITADAARLRGELSAAATR